MLDARWDDATYLQKLPGDIAGEMPVAALRSVVEAVMAVRPNPSSAGGSADYAWDQLFESLLGNALNNPIFRGKSGKVKIIMRT